MSDEETIKRALRHKKKHTIRIKDLLSSGSTMVNLAATNRPNGCFKKGHYYWFVGDSQSGKTFLALTCMAEACINPEFDNYRIIYSNSEDGALMDIERYFGPAVAKRLEPPKGTREAPIYPKTSEEMYFYIKDAIYHPDGRPFIFIQDSTSSLDTEADRAKFDERKKAHDRGKDAGDVSGTYGTSAAMINSQNIKRVIYGIRESGSIVILISQTRQNIGRNSLFDPRTVAGGKALKFYATLEIWTAVKEKIKRVVRGKQRKIGIQVKVDMKKNRITGNDRTVVVPIYPSTGVDDIGSMINFLVSEQHWKGGETDVSAPEFDFKGKKEALVRKIENDESETELKALVKRVWDEIEEACEVKRKPKYGQAT